MPVEGLDETIKRLKTLVSLGQLALTEAYENDKDVPRWKVHGLITIADMALLSIDPERAGEFQELIAWGQKVAKELGLD